MMIDNYEGLLWTNTSIINVSIRVVDGYLFIHFSFGIWQRLLASNSTGLLRLFTCLLWICPSSLSIKASWPFESSLTRLQFHLSTSHHRHHRLHSKSRALNYPYIIRVWVKSDSVPSPTTSPSLLYFLCLITYGSSCLVEIGSLQTNSNSNAKYPNTALPAALALRGSGLLPISGILNEPASANGPQNHPRKLYLANMVILEPYIIVHHSYHQLVTITYTTLTYGKLYI